MAEKITYSIFSKDGFYETASYCRSNFDFDRVFVCSAARGQPPKSILCLPAELFTEDSNLPAKLNSWRTLPQREGSGPFAPLTLSRIVAVSLFSVAGTGVA